MPALQQVTVYKKVGVACNPSLGGRDRQIPWGLMACQPILLDRFWAKKRPYLKNKERKSGRKRERRKERQTGGKRGREKGKKEGRNKKEKEDKIYVRSIS